MSETENLNLFLILELFKIAMSHACKGSGLCNKSTFYFSQTQFQLWTQDSSTDNLICKGKIQIFTEHLTLLIVDCDQVQAQSQK